MDRGCETAFYPIIRRGQTETIFADNDPHRPVEAVKRRNVWSKTGLCTSSCCAFLRHLLSEGVLSAVREITSAYRANGTQGKKTRKPELRCVCRYIGGWKMRRTTVLVLLSSHALTHLLDIYYFKFSRSRVCVRFSRIPEYVSYRLRNVLPGV